MASNTDSSSSSINTFYLLFQEEHSILDALIDNLSALSTAERIAAIDDYLLRINHLSDKVKDAASYLPPYDQRKYSERIKGLSDKLSHSRKALAPKQKFAFKSKAKPATPSNSNKSSATPTTSSPAVPISSSQPQNHISIASLDSTYVHPLPLLQSSPVSISSLTSCFVDLTPPHQQPEPSMIAVKDITSSILFAPYVSGPAHLTSIRSSILILSCAQFRMHDTHDTDVYLLCPSRPIIEDCSGIRFAPFPTEWIPPEVRNEQEAAEGRRNMWDQVDDFKWLRVEHSPNWSVMRENERVEGVVFREVLESTRNILSKAKEQRDKNIEGVLTADVDIQKLLRSMGKEENSSL